MGRNKAAERRKGVELFFFVFFIPALCFLRHAEKRTLSISVTVVVE